MARDWVFRASLDASRASKRQHFNPSEITRKPKWPWLDIEVGQHFDIPDGKPASVSAMSAKWSERTGRVFSVSKMTGFVRVKRKE